MRYKFSLMILIFFLLRFFSAPDSNTGQEGTIILQDYLPEMFFHPLDTRGFLNYNYNETVEFQNILQGKIQAGDNVYRLKEDQEDVSAMDLHL